MLSGRKILIVQATRYFSWTDDRAEDFFNTRKTRKKKALSSPVPKVLPSDHAAVRTYNRRRLLKWPILYVKGTESLTTSCVFSSSAEAITGLTGVNPGYFRGKHIEGLCSVSHIVGPKQILKSNVRNNKIKL